MTTRHLPGAHDDGEGPCGSISRVVRTFPVDVNRLRVKRAVRIIVIVGVVLGGLLP